MAKKTYNAPISIQVYLGSGKGAQSLRENLNKLKGDRSLSKYVVALLLAAAPELFTASAKNGSK